MLMVTWFLTLHTFATGLEIISQCKLTEDERAEIHEYREFVFSLYEKVVNGSQAGLTYRQAAEISDDFGPRFVGTQTLDDAIDFTVNRLVELSLDRVWTEEVQVPLWKRGQEYAHMVFPRIAKLAMLGLGGSIGTPPEGIVAEAIVVKTFGDLRKKANLANGRIVVFNQDYVSYQNSALYRLYGAQEVAKVGGIAALVRSSTALSLNTLHGGILRYDANIPAIPSASITVEDAEMLYRLHVRGRRIVLTLRMDARNLPPVKSRNIIAEITGRSKPEEYVVVSAHIDSWDVGQGAVDDGAGAALAVRVMEILNRMSFKPRRTIRLVIWTGEELARTGRLKYIESRSEEPHV